MKNVREPAGRGNLHRLWCVGIVLLVCRTCCGQSLKPKQDSTPLKFEVASVKQVDPRNPGLGRSYGPDESGMRLVSDLGFFISLAYGLGNVQITGLPAWTNGRFYEIAAKTSSPATPAEVEQMLRFLLKERFRLATHFETTTAPVYSLVISNDGIRMEPVGPAVPISYSSRPGSLSGVLTTSRLAEDLTASLRRTVIDNTGLSQHYRLNLRWSPTLEIESEGDTPDGVSLFTALQEQLGLKLKSAKGPVKTLVIDHVEAPSSN